jgi:O-antigen ligase
VIAWAVFLLPFALTVSMFPLPHVGIVARVLILISVAPGALYLVRGLRRNEVRWACVLLLYLLASCLSTFFAADLEAALLDFARQAYVVIVSILLMLSLRDLASRVALTYGMAFMAVVGALTVFILYLSYVGFSFADLADLQTFKFTTQTSLGLPLNPTSFAIVLAFLLAYPAFSRPRWFILSATVLVLAATFLSGSRTTLVSLSFSALVVGLIIGGRQLPPWLRRTGYFLVPPALIAAAVYMLSVGDSYVDPQALSTLTSERTSMWSAALEKFSQRPLTGWGADSWKINLPSYLRVYDPERLMSITSVKAGAFHNTYLTILAEKGLMVFVPALVMAGFLVWQSWTLHAHRRLLTKLDAGHAAVAPLIVILILVRGLGEHAGWWGYADGTVDYLSYVAASLIVATATQLDRITYPKQPKKGGRRIQR